MTFKKKIEKAARLISESRRAVALTGAGVSAESGISTFRDKGGIWDRYPEGDSGGIMAVMANHPEDTSEILMGFMDGMRAARPNPGHKALADLEEMGYLSSVITQNVDNLHREGGNSRVLEMHGNIYRLRCTVCEEKKILQREAFFEMMSELIMKTERFSPVEMISRLPLCSCGGNTRPDAVAFGEPVQDLQEAIAESKACDLMLILGTSGVVYPAASLPSHARIEGARLIEINPQKSALTSKVDLFIEGKTGEILPRIVSLVKEMTTSQ
ncbi:MAG: NAD-dependent deacylase [Thermodesulfobacteriota bacterium]|nr:NAD-dependent deacylase [Thermodesulfobacteriota bacterium]